MVLTTPPVHGGPLLSVAARAGEKAPPDYGDSSQWAGRAVIVRRRRACPASPGTGAGRGPRSDRRRLAGRCGSRARRSGRTRSPPKRVDGHNCGQRARQAHIDGELRLAQNLGGGIDANSSLALDNPVYRSTPLAARLRALASFSAIVAIDSTPLSLTSRGVPSNCDRSAHSPDPGDALSPWKS